MTKQLGFSLRLTDGVIAAVALVVVKRLVENGQFRALPLRYALLFASFVYVAMAGSLVNGVEPLVTLAGIRTYFKYVPLFLLPFAFNYTEKAMRWQFLMLLVLALLQLPVALWQRFVRYSASFSGARVSGDAISGTLGVSNSLTIVLVAVITVMTAAYLRRRISLAAFITVSLLLFVPCTLNETKVTVVLLPIGIGSVLFVMRREIALRKTVWLALTGLLLLGTFVAVYERLYGYYARDVAFVDLLTDEKYDYQSTGAGAAHDALSDRSAPIAGAIKSLRTGEEQVGRLDSFRVPVEALYDHDPVRLLLGLGIGNVHSSMGRGGAFREIGEQLSGNMTALAQLLWESGLLGATLFVTFLTLVARDAARLSRSANGWGVFAAGWFGVTLLIMATLPYNTLFHFDEIACLFFYFSGMVVYRARAGGDA